MSSSDNPWTTLSSRVVHDGPLFTVLQDDARNERAGVSSYAWVRFNVVGVAVLPVDEDGCTYVVGQHRYPSGRFTWELVRGAGDLSTLPQESAARELREETGLTAKRWLQLLDLSASPGVSDEKAPCFVAWDLARQDPDPDPQEQLRVRRLCFRDAVQEVLDGTIADASSVALIMVLHARLFRGDLPDELMGALKGRS